jgi:hypothetical protein
MGLNDQPHLLSRKDLAARWDCSIATIKRNEKRKGLKKVTLGPRTVRYRLADVIAIEASTTA